ncbi:MAG: hypothetical protein F4058_04835 [Rhodothermaceae bacterium]|nr:hypothetical protein [Rhodothermaceae bacterium]
MLYQFRAKWANNTFEVGHFVRNTNKLPQRPDNRGGLIPEFDAFLLSTHENFPADEAAITQELSGIESADTRRKARALKLLVVAGVEFDDARRLPGLLEQLFPTKETSNVCY